MPRPSTFVLVHGGWHGGWCWTRVAPVLRAAGHTVFTPTLTGLGERVDQLQPTVTLETHVQDIVRVFEYEDVRSVILVGHSYGGMVISGVGARLPERVAKLVFVDAFVPEPGQSALDLLPPERADQFRAQAAERGQGWLIPPPPPELYGVSDAADAEWVRARLGPQPLATLEQPLPAAAPASIARAYVACTEFAAFRTFADHAQTSPEWRYREIASGHDVMLTQPLALAEALMALA